MNKVDQYRLILQSLPEWEEYLLKESGLPGPRGNLELAQAVADLGSRKLFEYYLSYSAEKAPVNDPHEFLAFCGAVGLGRLLAEGVQDVQGILRRLASDPRWRMREGVAMALQRWGRVDMPALLQAMERWSSGNWLEKRAAAAALAEPALLHEEMHAVTALKVLDRITTSMVHSSEAHISEYKTLHQGMCYCWSVVVAAANTQGKALMEKWLDCADPLIRRMMLENLKKNRLIRMDPEWVERQRSRAF